MRHILSAAALTMLAVGAAHAEPAMTAAPTSMRAAPSPRAHIVQDVPAHAQIDVSHCGEDWCSASWREISGFVAVRDITSNDAPLVHARPPHPPYFAPYVGFGWGYGWHRREYY